MPSSLTVEPCDPAFHVASARAAAFDRGALIDVSPIASDCGLDSPVAIHATVINMLSEHPNERRNESRVRQVLESVLRKTRNSLPQDVHFDHIYAKCGQDWHPRLGARRTILDDGEQVITIFADPLIIRERGDIRHPSKGIEQLPTPRELVRALRMAWCDPDASVGRRPEGRHPPINRSTNWGDQPDLDQDAQIHSLVSGDPVAAAQLAEELGFWSRASDCWLLAGDVVGALDVIPIDNPRTSGGKSWIASSRIILALVLGRTLSAADLIVLHKNRLTIWGRKHLDEVVQCVQSQIDMTSGTSDDVGLRLLHFEDLRWSYAWHPLGIHVASPDQPVAMFWPWLGESELGAAYCAALVRHGENSARINVGQHRVGEGWISETELFNVVSRHFGQVTMVIQHGKPPGFSRQHLDIWIPDWNIGIEYQGLQHDQPVDFFGGEDAWRRTIVRDERKRALCSQLGITLIEVRPGFDTQVLISDIERCIPH